jgi:hypothetical protein
LSKTSARSFRKLCDREYVNTLIERLCLLAEASDPVGGSETERGKDLRAFQALQTMGDLVNALAGWAINHTVGLSKKDLAFLPLQPAQTKRHRDYVRTRSIVDRHEHELDADLKRISDPQFARRLLINLLRANSGGWPPELVSNFISALEGLHFGEMSPLFKPIKKGRKVGLAEMQLQLRAVCIAEYFQKQGLEKHIALKKVADAFKVDTNTVKSWKLRLSQASALGHLQVQRSIAFAQNYAANKKGDLLYGQAALNEFAEKYKTLIHRQKN